MSETAESFTVSLDDVTSSLLDQVSMATSSATATIAESDGITVSIAGPTTVAEGATTASYTVSLSGGTPTEDLTVNYSTANGTATAGSDYTTESGTLTFSAGDTADKTFTVQTAEDSVDEPNEDFTVSISNPQGGGGPAPSLGTDSVTTLITDNDGTPNSITLTVDPDSISEDDDATSFTVKATIDGASTLPVETTVTLTLSGAATTSDYTVVTVLDPITIPAGQASATGTLALRPTDDEIVEGNETIVIVGTTTVAGLNVTSATITLVDGNVATPGNPSDRDSAELSITGPTVNVDEGDNAVFVVTLSHQVAAEVRVAWTAPLGTDVAEGTDLGSISGAAVFAANSAAGATTTVTIAVTDDMLSERAESFTVSLGTITLTLASQVSVKSGASSATATIAESDPITVSIAGPANVAEGTTTTAYTVSLSGGTPTEALTVSYATADGTATAGSDYTSKSGTLRFTPADHADQTFTVQTIQDSVHEGAGESFSVTISDAQGGGASPVLGASSVTTTITDDDGAPSGIALSVEPATIAEDAATTTVVVTATLNGGTTRSADTVVTISTLAGTATTSDYTMAAALASITIPAGARSATGTLSITPVDDQIVEGDETIVVPGTTTAGLSVASAVITLTDGGPGDKDSATLSIAGPAANVDEGAGAVFVVTLSHQVDAEVTVSWSATSTEAATTDYGPASGSVTFAANSAAGATTTITVAVTDDNLLSETEERFTVSLGAITSTLASQVSTSTASATATIVESDPITVSIAGPANVAEGTTTTAYTVSLSGGTPTEALTVSYATADGTATAGSDYTSKSGTLRFTPADHADQTFTVQTTEDSLAEGAENFTVSISGPAGGGGPGPTLGTASASTTITDDDGTPDSITLTVDPDSIGEDDGRTDVTVTATIDGDSTLPATTTVTLTLSGTATTSDYTVNTALASVTIPAGQSSGAGTLRLTPVDDQVVEGDETIEVSGSAGSFTVRPATVTLTDGVGATPDNPNDRDNAALSIAGPATTVAEGSSATFVVTLSHQVDADVTVEWSATSTDAAVSDYSPASGSVTFPANSAVGATKNITITATQDLLSETAETFTVSLGAITSTLASQVSSSTASATATISESDPITVSITGPSSVAEGTTTAVYVVSITGGVPTASLTVDYATADGTATAGSDYATTTGTLTFPASSAVGATRTFTVQTTEDSVDEGTGETFTVSISSPQGGGASPALGTNSVTTTITDDDAAPSGIVLSASPSSISEGATTTTITVTATLNGSTLPTETVVTIGTLSGTATGSDYAVGTALASITIPVGAASAKGTLAITPVDDSVVEGDETIVIPGTTDVAGLNVTSATITLTDGVGSTPDNPNDRDSATVSIAGPATPVSEGSSGTFVVTLSHQVDAAVTVAWSATSTEAAASDYSPALGSVTFPANSAAGATSTITVAVTDDNLSETEERFTVSLGAITSTLSSQVSTSTASATATISESDPITVSISGPASVTEGTTTTAYTVSITGGVPTANLTVDYATADGTATAGSDYATTTGTLTFPASSAVGATRTFTVQTTQDNIDEPNESFAVSISGPAGGGGPAPSLDSSKTSVTTSITDDDGTPNAITLSVDPTSLGEDDGATSFTVTATIEGGSTLPANTIVNIALAGSAATSSDYTVTKALAAITIPANSQSATGTLTLTPVDDSVVEGDEAISVTGAAQDLTVRPATITLTDDDKTTTGDPGDKDSATLSIAGPTTNVDEGASATFVVTLSHQVDADVTVAWSATSTEAAVSDYSPASGSVTFPANSAAGATTTITIAITDDNLSETAETFTVSLGAITSTLSSQVSTSTAGATATISESDPITVSISGPASVTEGTTATAYTVSLSGGTPTDDLIVNYSTADGTAASSTDYTAKSGTLTFTRTAAGPQTFAVQTTDDNIDEGTGETFTASISSPQGGGGPAPRLGTDSVTTTITDDDTVSGDISLAVSPRSISEYATTTSFTATATIDGGIALATDTVVTLSLGGTATSSDYKVASKLSSITIPANSQSATGTLAITPVHDEIVEGDETIDVSGTATGFSVNPATITLIDHNRSRSIVTGRVSITGPSGPVAEGADAAFIVTLSKAVAADVTVAWSATSTDAATSDYGPASGSVTFPANSAAGATTTITVAVAEDDLSEGAEVFTASLDSITSTLSSQVFVDSDAGSAQATIAASDPITVFISDAPSEVDEGDVATYTVSISGGVPTADLTVAYATSDGSADSSTDYTAASSTLTFTGADTGDKTVEVQTTPDIISERGEKDFTFTISNPRGGGHTPTLGTSTVTTVLLDDDATNAPQENRPGGIGDVDIWLTVDPDSVNENGGATTFTVTATHNDAMPPSTSTTINLTLAGTADSSDYTAPTQASVTIPAHASSGTGTLVLTLIDDNVSEGDETIIVDGRLLKSEDPLRCSDHQ